MDVRLANIAGGNHNRAMPTNYFTAAEDAKVLSLPSAEVHRLTGRSLKTIGVRPVRLKRMGFSGSRPADQRRPTQSGAVSLDARSG